MWLWIWVWSATPEVLMPAMDAFRQRWPEVELDIVCGFHPDPIALVMQDRAEVAIVSEEDPDDMPGIVRQVLGPGGVEPAQRRTKALTVGMLQLVASGRGIATLPLWGAQNDLDRGDVTARAIGRAA